MTIYELIQQKGRYVRLGFFASWAMIAIPPFFHLKAPYSYSIGLGFILLFVVLVIAYRSIKCPRCGGSLWIAGMGFIAPGDVTGPGHICPKCKVHYSEQTVP